MPVRDENGVPILALSRDSAERVKDRHARAVDPHDEDEQTLVGTVVALENKRPIGAADTPDVTYYTIGGETVDEAAKTIVGTFEDFHSHDKPSWVASTDDHLAEVLAEHYSCDVRAIEDVQGNVDEPEEIVDAEEVEED